MKHKLLTCLLALCMVFAMLPATALADGDGSSGPAAKIGNQPYDTVEAAIEKAVDGDVVTILAGTHQSAGQEVNVNASITITGEGARASELVDYVFNVSCGSEGVSVTFENLSFTGNSRIMVGGDNNGTANLIVNNCYAYLTWSSSEDANKGEFIRARGGYSNYLDLTVTGCELINAHSIANEDAAPIIFGDGNLLRTATITNNTFGSADHRCDRVVIKFGRRTNGTQINISNNTIYGATTTEKDFNIMELYQSGKDPYDGLKLIVADNTVDCTIDEGRSASAAFVHNDVMTTAAKPSNIIAADGNTVNGEHCDAVVNAANATDFPVAEAKLVTADGTTTYFATAQEAINAANTEGSTVKLLQDVAGNLSISGKTGLTVDGNRHSIGSVNFGGVNDGVTLKNADFIMTEATTVNVNGSNNDNITISGCTFTLNQAPEPWAAIYVQVTSKGLTIENNEFYISRENADSTISAYPGQGFQCIGFAFTESMHAYDVVIRNNTLTEDHTNSVVYFLIGGNGIKNSDKYDIEGLEITGNKITSKNIGSTYGASLANINELTVTGNEFNCAVGVSLETGNGVPTKDVTVTGNSGSSEKIISISGGKPITGSFDTDVPADKIYNNNDTAAFITVSFNANGGSCSVSSKVIALTDGSVKLGELPVPTRSGSYSFAGWFDENGKLVTADTVLTKSTELYARWDYTGPIGSTVTVAETEHGSVKVEPNFADVGDTVTITATPDTGYRVKDVVVTDIYGDELDVSRASDGTYSFIMPRSRVTVTVTFEQLSTSFTDVSADDYYYDAVIWAVKNGVTTGITDTTFGPNLACTRAQMVTFLWRAAGSPVVDAANPFYDVQPGDYYYDAVKWAVSKGITTGVTASTFCPDDTVSRAQTVTFLWRFDGSKAAEGSSFTDVDADAYYAAAVDWAVANGVTDGLTSTGFGPDAACTRAQIVTFLYRYMG